jgi:hypothetical protein
VSDITIAAVADAPPPGTVSAIVSARDVIAPVDFLGKSSTTPRPMRIRYWIREFWACRKKGFRVAKLGEVVDQIKGRSASRMIA